MADRRLATIPALVAAGAVAGYGFAIQDITKPCAWRAALHDSATFWCENPPPGGPIQLKLHDGTLLDHGDTLNLATCIRGENESAAFVIEYATGVQEVPEANGTSMLRMGILMLAALRRKRR